MKRIFKKLQSRVNEGAPDGVRRSETGGWKSEEEMVG